ncbi:hypothetical protein OG407_27610 [Streptomyces sp. NBC_01515]|uniref:hypothetical protein n=1 Tax=Streptomyces sp. NBC_01515 TaxID=2903890 RepID=UPI00386C43C2
MAAKSVKVDDLEKKTAGTEAVVISSMASSSSSVSAPHRRANTVGATEHRVVERALSCAAAFFMRLAEFDVGKVPING